jgi:3-oxoacyl-[acyl-carrier-protein] synthase-1
MGAVTPVGVGIAQTVCSIRAGTCRMQEMAGLYQCTPQDADTDSPEPVVAARLGFVERNEASQQEQWSWLARLLALAFQDLQRMAPEIQQNPSRLGIFVALPLPRIGLSQDVARHLLVGFYNHACIDPCGQARLLFGGHAGFFALAMDACEAIGQGQIDAALVGGVDSYLFRPLLASLDQAYRLKSTRNLDGFRPAEGAGFVLLQPVRRTGVAPLALLDGLAASELPTGDQALTEVLRRLQHRGVRPSRIISDLNGETARAREWSIVATRLGNGLGDASALEHPAIATGDLGAATGPVLLSYAVHALARTKQTGQQVWVYTSSDDPLRAGASLRTPNAPS